ncbi:MAG: hypothetical protein OXU61_00925, partial [Gammaproteobacteria bacterium]|nr:hypothetical protein [Gammaproteobacteria bacterium]
AKGQSRASIAQPASRNTWGPGGAGIPLAPAPPAAAGPSGQQGIRTSPGTGHSRFALTQKKRGVAKPRRNRARSEPQREGEPASPPAKGIGQHCRRPDGPKASPRQRYRIMQAAAAAIPATQKRPTIHRINRDSRAAKSAFVATSAAAPVPFPATLSAPKVRKTSVSA